MALDELWNCETCFHYRNNMCCPSTWCEHGESYRPAYDKLIIVDAEEIKYANWNLELSWYGGNSGVSCSRCHWCSAKNDTEVMGYKRCPNCGAHMRNCIDFKR